jgi:glycine amidinotransferase/scyllo-inosamine-4-phosphate amidinotransferase 1
MMINSYDEWSQLRKVIVGDATNANWPTTDPVFALESQKTTWRETPVPSGPVPQWIIDEANQDLDILASTLTSLGVEVLRPSVIDFQGRNGFYNYCPRDRFLIYGSWVIDTAMMYPSRDMEREAYETFWDEAEQFITMDRSLGYVLDAANVLKLGPEHMLYLQSPSGNLQSYEYLSTMLPEVNIELCNFYAGVHIDSTVMPLREGLVLLNASRVNESNCPRVFDTWQKVWVQDVRARDFYQYPYASKWIGMNLLVVNSHTVIVDTIQQPLIETLRDLNFDVIELELRHSRTLGGGFHCVTLDLSRYD